MSKQSEPDWEYQEFRTTVLEAARRVNLKSPAQISRAMGEHSDSKVSRWFSGIARPLPSGIEQLAGAITEPDDFPYLYGELMRLAGHDPQGMLRRPAPVPRPGVPAVVGEIATMFGPTSPLSAESRTKLEDLLDQVIDRYRKEMQGRRKPA